MSKISCVVATLLAIALAGCFAAEPSEHAESTVATTSTTAQDVLQTPGSPRAPCPPGSGPCTDMYVVAHSDDDLYFMNPDIENSMASGNNVVVVYTEGADPSPANEPDWTNRERGILDAYAQMADPAYAWSIGYLTKTVTDGTGTHTINSAAVYSRPLRAPFSGRRVTLIGLRITDPELEYLWSGRGYWGQDDNDPAHTAACTHCIANQTTATTYTRAELIDTLAGIMQSYGATSVSTLDASGLNYGAFTDPHSAPYTENGSHVSTGLFAVAAARKYQALIGTSVFLRFYRGYSNGQEPANLSPAEQAEKCRIASYYEAWECLEHGGAPCSGTNPPVRAPQSEWCTGPAAFFSDSRMYSTRSVLGTGPLQGRLAINSSTTAPACIGVNSTSTLAITTSCASAPSWIITQRNQLQLAGTTSCLRADPASAAVQLATCNSSDEWMTFFVMSNGQILARDRGDLERLPNPFPPNQLGSCVSANQVGAPITYGLCAKNCVNKTTGAIDPSCTSDNHICSTVDEVDGPGCAGAGLTGGASQACLPGYQGDGATYHCFAVPGNTPTAGQDFTMVFDPPRLVSSEFSSSTEVGTANTYYRTFAIGDKSVCVRRADGVSCASADLARGASVASSSSYQVAPWGAANVVDGSVVSQGSSYGFSTAPGGSAPAYLELDLPSITTFDRVVLYPRTDAGNVGVGFPISFSIQVWDGASWLTRLTRTNYPAPGGQAQTFSWGFADTTDRVRIYATALPSTASGFVMQFAEVEVYNYGTASTPSLRSSTQLTSSFADSAGWATDANGSTVRAVWDNHAQQLIACGRGYYGVSCSNGLSTSSFSTPDGWDAASYRYDSVRYIDMNGDGAPDVCGRGVSGVSCALNGLSSFPTAQLWASDFSEAAGWNQASNGETVMYGDVNGDGKPDVCGRGAFTIECSLQTAAAFDRHHDWSWYGDRRAPTAGGEFGNFDVLAFPGSAARWNTSSAYYGSIRLIDINRDGFADICGRSSNGTYCALSMGNRFDRKHEVILHTEDLTDAAGWSATSSGSTLSFGDLNGDARIDLCARGSGGIVCTTGY